MSGDSTGGMAGGVAVMKIRVTPGQRPLKPVRGRLQGLARGANIPHGADHPSGTAHGAAPTRPIGTIHQRLPDEPPCGAADPDGRSGYRTARAQARTARSRPRHPRPGFPQEGLTKNARPSPTPPATAQRQPPKTRRGAPMRPPSPRQARQKTPRPTTAPAPWRAT